MTFKDIKRIHDEFFHLSSKTDLEITKAEILTLDDDDLLTFLSTAKDQMEDAKTMASVCVNLLKENSLDDELNRRLEKVWGKNWGKKHGNH